MIFTFLDLGTYTGNVAGRNVIIPLLYLFRFVETPRNFINAITCENRPNYVDKTSITKQQRLQHLTVWNAIDQQ